MLMKGLAVLLAGAATAGATDWSQWRGPDRDAVADSSPLAEWPEALLPRWTAVVGSGQSSPVVAHGRVFVFTREGDDEVARALDLRTGRPVWRTAYPAAYSVYPGAASYGGGPKSTPVVHDGRLFTLGIGGLLTAFDAEDGRVLWRKDFTGRFQATAPPFGTAMSPLIANGLLVVHAGGHEGGALIALDPATGGEKWTLTGDGPSYSSPILTTLAGQQQLVLQVHRKVLGVEPLTGRVLWSFPFVTPCDQNIVTPLRASDLVVVSSQDTGTQALRLTRKGDTWVPEVAWHTADVSMYMSSPVLAGGRVVGLSHRRRGQYFALDPATGRVEWTSDQGQGENAALVLTPTGLLALQGDGTLLVLPRDAASFTPSHRYRLGDGATYAHPVPTEAGLLVKDDQGLALFGAAPAAGAAGR
jgi:outer membrane protein assembly factor BamB